MYEVPGIYDMYRNAVNFYGVEKVLETGSCSCVPGPLLSLLKRYLLYHGFYSGRMYDLGVHV